MDDLIRRQEVIDAIEFGITYARAINKETGEVKELFREGNNELKKAVERVKALPSAQPEQKWIPVTKKLPESSHAWRTGYLTTVFCKFWKEKKSNVCRVGKCNRERQGGIKMDMEQQTVPDGDDQFKGTFTTDFSGISIDVKEED